MTKYTLIYFNAPGRAELIRFIFAQAGVEYEDRRLTQDEWAQFKDNTPYGSLPVLEVDGKMLAGSHPIARFLAERHGLAGANDFENAEIAGVADCVHDLALRVVMLRFEQDETRKASLKKDLEEKHFPKYLGALEKRAVANNCAEGWLYGSKVTYADFGCYLVLNFVLMVDPDALDNYPALKKLRAAVENLPNIAKWLKERPPPPQQHT